MRMVVIVRATDRAAEKRVALEESAVEIGGASDCTAVLDNPSVGAARIRFEREADQWIVVDQEGLCSVGAVRLRPRVPRIVRPPHRVRIGEIALVVAVEWEASLPKA